MSAAPRLLVVNADDFGFRLSIDRAVLRAAEHGIVTSAAVIPTVLMSHRVDGLTPPIGGSLDLPRREPERRASG